MELQLQGRTAFVSGSTQGIGFAIASALAAEGVRVIVNGRSSGRVDAAVARLREAHRGVDHLGLVADFASPDEVVRLLEDLGDVDILVNNVGLFGLADFGSISDDEWARYLDVNLMSAVRLSRHVVGGMLQRGWGRILLISSESGVNVPADMVHYGVTKAAMIALGNGLAKLTRGSAVTVNTVLGGPTYSDGVAATVESIAHAQSAPVEAVKAAIIGQNATTLLHRFIAPSEIANIVTYLASPLASATNGAAVRADGGVLTAML
ncbi:SDR family NAD(P)-dependent oxidoreductase [Microbacterium immunditiarum]|uniref:NAD(P)-dependent dehydrogenase (Short-subunit alcohol dehydrogenase family) n=1 Tax=Microbacterium immunditiarum TaxID=337480 RepID=A0A7Y9KKP9_9MICO|nr:SDR family NAD(P)-dependent oxidoreductase [Microbacterium immunditiarum]NYE18984.1 NAD(P)-dependent dehydrogenase (short-subunit alcohol dehydrogenase family) [Microbacterium immunditiarum]